jgi:oligoendopeptidase F
VTDKKISDDLRGFKNPWSATILGYQNDEKAIIALVDAVTEAFDISHRFYKVKAKLMGVKSLSYADRSAPIGKNKTKIPFSEAVSRYRAVLAGIDPEYVGILDRFLKDGQIDVYPKAGKSGGAYCSSNIDSPTMVLLNHTDDFKSFMTLAHEMGHAIHAEMSKKQPLFYQGHTIVPSSGSSFSCHTRGMSEKVK